MKDFNFSSSQINLPKYLEEYEHDVSEKEELQIKLAIMNSLEDSIKSSKNEKELIEMKEKLFQLNNEIQGYEEK